MAKVLFAWELGLGYGHVGPIRAMAQEVRNQGHECVMAMRALGSALQTFGPDLGALHQAPVRLSQPRNPVKVQTNYASLLHNAVFDDNWDLSGRIAAWRQLAQDSKAEVIFADHSPTAIIAARTLNLPVCHTGTGFTVPPVLTPFPSFRPKMKIPDSVLLNNEAQVVAELNRALERLKLASFEKLQDMFAGQQAAVFSYPELDHYPIARPEPFHGVPPMSTGAPPPWPAGSGPRVLAYLRPNKALPATMEALQKSKARVIVRIGDIPPKQLAKYARPGLVITERALDFAQAAQDCDAFVGYGSHGTTAEFLLAGKPGVLLADLHERVLVARRAVEMGACLSPRKEVPEISRALEQVLDDPTCRTRAQAFARKYEKQDRAAILPALVASVLKKR